MNLVFIIEQDLFEPFYGDISEHYRVVMSSKAEVAGGSVFAGVRGVVHKLFYLG